MKIENVTHPTRGHVMDRRIKEASFEEWLAYVFDRPECDFGDHWSFGSESPDWDTPQELSAQFIARTYEDPAHWLPRFSNAQIAAGLEFTWNPAFGGVYSALCHVSTPIPLRQRAIRALVPLYEDCFRPRCLAALSHLGEAVENPLNGACYMYWDVCPLYAQSEKAEHQIMDDECLRVMEATLQIDHDACRESALHGLGHWQHDYPSRVTSIIEYGLDPVRNRLRPEVLSYAGAASRGCVQ